MTSNWMFSERTTFNPGNESLWATPCPHCGKKSLHTHSEQEKITCHCCGYEVKK